MENSTENKKNSDVVITSQYINSENIEEPEERFVKIITSAVDRYNQQECPIEDTISLVRFALKQYDESVEIKQASRRNTK